MANLTEANQDIFNRWCEYQEKAGFPKPEYSVEAYTQDNIDMWKMILEQEEA